MWVAMFNEALPQYTEGVVWDFSPKPPPPFRTGMIFAVNTPPSTVTLDFRLVERAPKEYGESVAPGAFQSNNENLLNARIAAAYPDLCPQATESKSLINVNPPV